MTKTGNKIMGIKTISDADEENFRQLLVGRRVLRIEDQTLTLDNETQVELVDVSDHYAWFEGSVENVISDVSERTIDTVVRDENPESRDGFIVHVLSGDVNLFDVVVEGVWEWGYCANSIDIHVLWGRSRRQF